MVTYLVNIPSGYVQERDEQFQFNQRLQVGEAVSYVLDFLAVQLRADRAGRPEVVHVAQFVVQPQAGIRFSGHGYCGWRTRTICNLGAVFFAH